MLALVAGLLLGAIFFGGLWWTVRKGVVVQAGGALVFRQPAAAHGPRAGRVLFVAGGHWQRLLVCLLGFVMARLVVTWLTRRRSKPAIAGTEASHAP